METPDLATRLSELPVFAALSTVNAEELASGASVVVLRSGQTLFEEGDPPGDLFVVLTGELRVTCQAPSGAHVVVGRALSGAVLGEMSLLDQTPHSATVRATNDAEILRISAFRFVRLVNDAHPAAWTLLRAMREQLVQRLRLVDERVDAVLEPPNDARDSEALRTEIDGLWVRHQEGER